MNQHVKSASKNGASYSVAIDTGGTFTDVTLVERDTGRTWTAKTSSTPQDPSIGFINGISEILESAGVEPSKVSHVFHGTTVATNAILEMRGARSAMITTDGFRHVLEIGRHDIPRSANMYSWVKPARPIRPEDIYEVRERLDASGAVVDELVEADVVEAVRRIREQGIESISVCYIHAYANSAHEIRTREIILREYPEAMVSLSSEVLPTFREYERSMATALNAYVMPLIASYVSRLEGRLAEKGLSAPLLLMKSSGGVTGVETVRREPAHTALSGPAAGIVGAEMVGELAGEPRLITLDIGGTSADICLINGGRPDLTTNGAVGEWPLSLPMLDIHTIGAGGGSIARTSDGVLTVGPQSAGAAPGPVCYARGGTEPTVTDAHVVLGHLPRTILDGKLDLDVDGATRALETGIARPLGISVFEAARGIIDIANNNMMGAIRVVSVERGYDPRDFALVPFGGAGPLHGSFIGRLLSMRCVLVPKLPGVLSSVGLLISNLRNEFTRSCLLRGPDYDLERLAEGFRQLDEAAAAWLTAEKIPAGNQDIRWVVSMRYRNQGFELDVPWTGRQVSGESLQQAIASFHALHRKLYTFDQPDTPVEVAGIRAEAVGQLGRPDQPRLETGMRIEDAVSRSQKTYFDGELLDCKIYSRRLLGAGARISGPAIIEQLDATTFILPGQVATTDPFGNLVITES